MGTYKKTDALTLSIIEARLDAMNNELGERILRQSFSHPAAHLRDLGSVLLDKQERMISVGNYSPAHTAGGDIGLKGILDWIGRDNVHPDDFIVGNDPFIVRLGHVPDWSFLRPIYYEGELVFYHFFKTHQYDTGGAHMGAYYPGLFDCHAEGLLIPPVKLIEGGKLDEKLYSLILRNVRGPEKVRADNLLVYTSMKKAEERILHLLKTYGKDLVLEACDELIQRTETTVRKVISTWPAGTYYAERATDWDGTTNKPVWVRLRLTIKPEEGQLIFDFTESDPQVDFINISLGRTWVAVVSAVAWVLPPGMPRSQGLSNCIQVLTKEGTVLCPSYPATTGGQGPIMGGVITESCLIALGQAIPQETIAPWARHLCPKFQGKIRERNGNTETIKYYAVGTFHQDGGGGAVYGYDGTDGLAPYLAAGGLMKASVEVEEWDIPYRWLAYEFLMDSQGHGQWRGGLGTHIEMLNTVDPTAWKPHDCVVMTGNSDGEKFGPPGSMGGTGGKKNLVYIIRKGKRIQLHTMSSAYLQPGDIIWSESGGGGGVGNPLDRDIEKVRWDVLNGYTSNRVARNVYGVVMDPKTFLVDYPATEALRARKRKKLGQ